MCSVRIADRPPQNSDIFYFTADNQTVIETLGYAGISDSGLAALQIVGSGCLRELERFLLELGTDFAFIARQKRMTIGNQDYYLDLLFYIAGLRA